MQYEGNSDLLAAGKQRWEGLENNYLVCAVIGDLRTGLESVYWPSCGESVL